MSGSETVCLLGFVPPNTAVLQLAKRWRCVHRGCKLWAFWRFDCKSRPFHMLLCFVMFSTLLFFWNIMESCNYMTSCCCDIGCMLPWLPLSWRPHSFAFSTCTSKWLHIGLMDSCCTVITIRLDYIMIFNLIHTALIIVYRKTSYIVFIIQSQMIEFRN